MPPGSSLPIFRRLPEQANCITRPRGRSSSSFARRSHNDRSFSVMSERVLPLLLDARRARTQGPDAIEERQRGRLAEMVAYARAHSPYYRVLYKDLPDQVEDPTLLPVTDKKQLMAHFDDWVTDREVTIEKVRAFIGKPNLIGERFLDTYTPLTTSG